MGQFIQFEEQKEKWRKVSKALGTCGVPSNGLRYTLWESQKEKKRAERIFEEIMAENVPNLKDINLHIQEAQQTPSRRNSEIHWDTL